MTMVLRDNLRTSLRSANPVTWETSQNLVPYEEAISRMEARVSAIRRGISPEHVWLLEHPPIYTAGTSAKDADLIEARFPVYRSGRGGQFTYHGPGQRVAYVMLDLKQRGADLRAYVSALEEWIIRTLRRFGVEGERREARVGVWIKRPDKGLGREDKIAAIGIRMRQWVSFHGIALNVAPDLTHFTGIVPCGVPDQGVTSLADLGVRATMEDVDSALRASFTEVFGPRSCGRPDGEILPIFIGGG